MTLENMGNQEEVGVDSAPKPFDQNDTERIEELNAKFEKSTERYIDLEADSQNITGLTIKDPSNSQGRMLDVQSFERQGLLDGTYARNNNSIVFRKGESVSYIMDGNDFAVAKKLEASGYTKVEGVGVPALGDPEVYYAGQDDSTYRNIQEVFNKNKI